MLKLSHDNSWMDIEPASKGDNCRLRIRVSHRLDELFQLKRWYQSSRRHCVSTPLYLDSCRAVRHHVCFDDGITTLTFLVSYVIELVKKRMPKDIVTIVAQGHRYQRYVIWPHACRVDL